MIQGSRDATTWFVTHILTLSYKSKIIFHKLPEMRNLVVRYGAAEERSDRTLTSSRAAETVKTNVTAVLQGSERETQKIITSTAASRTSKTHSRGFFPPPQS